MAGRESLSGTPEARQCAKERALRQRAEGFKMKVRIIKDRFGGMGWRTEPGVLHLGGVGTAGVESLSFALPEEWSGMA